MLMPAHQHVSCKQYTGEKPHQGRAETSGSTGPGQPALSVDPIKRISSQATGNMPGRVGEKPTAHQPASHKQYSGENWGQPVLGLDPTEHVSSQAASNTPGRTHSHQIKWTDTAIQSREAAKDRRPDLHQVSLTAELWDF